jgi:hypothetical protein
VVGCRFVERHEAELTVQKASVLEYSRYEIAPDEMKRYFGILREKCRSVPSLLYGMSMRHELVHRKKTAPPNVIVAASTKPGTVIVPEEKDDAHHGNLSFWRPHDSNVHFENKTFDKGSVAAQQLFEGHDYTIRTTEKLSSLRCFLLTGYKMRFCRGCPICVKGPSTRAMWC